jgi:hypothetical protein
MARAHLIMRMGPNGSMEISQKGNNLREKDCFIMRMESYSMTVDLMAFNIMERESYISLKERYNLMENSRMAYMMAKVSYQLKMDLSYLKEDSRMANIGLARVFNSQQLVKRSIQGNSRKGNGMALEYHIMRMDQSIMKASSLEAISMDQVSGITKKDRKRMKENSQMEHILSMDLSMTCMEIK